MKFLNPDRLTTALKAEMEAYERYVLSRWPGASIVVHADWRDQPAAGVTVDQHCFGKAVDFHVEGVGVADAWLALERFGGITGVGFYPDWAPQPGFHADVRETPYRERWERDGQAYVAFNLAKMKEV